MFESPRRHHMYDPSRQKQSIRRIWQAPGHYHVIFIQSGNRDWIGYWSSVQLGKLPNKSALAEFLDYATHVVDNARKVGMIGPRPVAIYAFHEAQMEEHCRILGIPDVNAGDGAWMKIRHRHPFVPTSYTRMEGFDEFGEMDFSDMHPDIQGLAAEIDAEMRQPDGSPGESDELGSPSPEGANDDPTPSNGSSETDPSPSC